MIITGSKIEGVHLIDLQRHQDERGFFARAWCRREFEAAGIQTEFVQANLSFSQHRGTLRGLHYQTAPHEESKLIRCVRGAIYDVAADLRPDSPTYGGWVGAELTASNRTALYVPPGCAHAFLSLTDETEVLYQVSAFYTPGAERGIRWDDPWLAIEWPIPVAVVSDKDRGWPRFEPEAARVPGRTGITGAAT